MSCLLSKILVWLINQNKVVFFSFPNLSLHQECTRASIYYKNSLTNENNFKTPTYTDQDNYQRFAQ